MPDKEAWEFAFFLNGVGISVRFWDERKPEEVFYLKPLREQIRKFLAKKKQKTVKQTKFI